MAKKITIRPATLDDARALAYIIRITWIYTYKGVVPDEVLLARTSLSNFNDSVKRWEESLRKAATDAAKVYRVAEDENGEVVGFTCGGTLDTPELKTDKELAGLYVHPAVHSSGAGKALMFEFARLMKAQGAATFGVGCLTGNKIGMGFYKHMGGKPVFEIPCERLGGVPETYFEYDISEFLKNTEEKRR